MISVWLFVHKILEIRITAQPPTLGTNCWQYYQNHQLVLSQFKYRCRRFIKQNRTKISRRTAKLSSAFWFHGVSMTFTFTKLKPTTWLALDHVTNAVDIVTVDTVSAAWVRKRVGTHDECRVHLLVWDFRCPSGLSKQILQIPAAFLLRVSMDSSLKPASVLGSEGKMAMYRQRTSQIILCTSQGWVVGDSHFIYSVYSPADCKGQIRSVPASGNFPQGWM